MFTKFRSVMIIISSVIGARFYLRFFTFENYLCAAINLMCYRHMNDKLTIMINT